MSRNRSILLIRAKHTTFSKMQYKRRLRRLYSTRVRFARTQVFATLRLLGFEKVESCLHIPYGLVKLPDGKMSSRKGNIIPFSQLKSCLGDTLHKIVPLADEDTIRKLSVATIRYGMLNQDNNKDIIFDIQSWTDLGGNTGTYLLYTYARIQKILLKVECSEDADFSKLELVQERKVLSAIELFSDTVNRAAKSYKPQIICVYLYQLCKDINKFYQQVKIYKTSDKALKKARLELLIGASDVLKYGLSLLRIETVQSM